MRPSSLVPLLFILWPIAEIATFIWVGGHIGVLNTIGLVLLSGFAGLALIRVEGFGLTRRLQADLAAGRMPAGRMLEALVVVIAGLLLILPGFLSDLLAFLLLFAPARRLLLTLIAARVDVTASGQAAHWQRRGGAEETTVIDLEVGEYSHRERNERQGTDEPRRPLPPGPPDDDNGADDGPRP